MDLAQICARCLELVTWKGVELELTCTRYHNGPRTDLWEVSGARVMIKVAWNGLELEISCTFHENRRVK